jgi:hypothetical protein
MTAKQVTIQLHKPSFNELLFFFLSGAIVSVPLTLYLEQSATPLLTGLSAVDIMLITVVVFAPFVEEFSKAFPLFYRHGETQRSIINLALCVGLGFGIVEIITYVGTFGITTIPLRVPGLFFHPASTSITAYGIATKRPVPFYLAAVGLHFTNNFFAFLGPKVIPISALVLVIAVYASWKLHEKAQEKFIDSDYTICPPSPTS